MHFFLAIVKSISNFQHLPKKDDPHTDIFAEIPAPKNMVRQMSKKPCFRELLDTEHGKLVERMLQSE